MAEYTKPSSVRLFADDTIILVYLILTTENYCEKADLQAMERWRVTG